MSRFDEILGALEAAGQLVRRPVERPDITAVTDDSRRVTRGALFCAIEGTVEDGHRFVPEAAERGAAAVLATRSLPVALPQVVVRDSRTAATLAARAWYGRPADHLTVVGVTGTNGKTTTVALARHLLNHAGTVGSIGTLGAFDGAGVALSGYGNLTTPGTVELQAVLREMITRRVDTVVMEASSHALDQRRLELVGFRGAVFTNLTHDHLDYHSDFDTYRQVKMRLSTQLVPGGVEVVNGDEAAWQALPVRAGIRRITFGTDRAADVAANIVDFGATGSVLTLRVEGKEFDVRLPLLGAFNVSNALAAAATAWGLGTDADAIVDRLSDAPQVPGRMETMVSQDFVVLRDYAHTPDALERAIAALRPLTAGRLIVLFGAGGDRDRAKRPVMGRVVARGADLSIVTSDNPRTEDPDRIIDDVVAGMGEAEHVRITDRREAIHRAIALLQPRDSLLLAGKGHERYQIVGTDRLPFDEADIVEDALRERTPA